MSKLVKINATPLVTSLLLCALCAILSACSTTQEPPQYSMRAEVCDEADATNLDCRLVVRGPEDLEF